MDYCKAHPNRPVDPLDRFNELCSECLQSGLDAFKDLVDDDQRIFYAKLKKTKKD